MNHSKKFLYTQIIINWRAGNCQRNHETRNGLFPPSKLHTFYIRTYISVCVWYMARLRGSRIVPLNRIWVLDADAKGRVGARTYKQFYILYAYCVCASGWLWNSKVLLFYHLIVWTTVSITPITRYVEFFLTLWNFSWPLIFYFVYDV